MKTFITLSVSKEDLILGENERQMLIKANVKVQIHEIVDRAIEIIEDNRGVQLKITNLPPRRGESFDGD